ncbi:hypothetical protein [Winogradskyella sp. 3972H.M.0a.05]|uniref:hypothetical protein n=1 Tax=Winogradskyella sp. 3972H.M.0a.05 TaxID=2950277 RepID=UPI0033996134
MKSINILLFFLAFSLFSKAQQGEFQTYSNGLIYDSHTISKLQSIVDSLNLQFKACELTESYYSKPQSKAIHLLSEKRSGVVYKALKDGTSPDELKKLYPELIISKPVLVSSHKRTNYKDEKQTVVQSITVTDDYEWSLYLDDHVDIPTTYKKGDWIIEKSKNRIEAFYLLEDFKSSLFKDVYAEMIQYADCMIDTTSTKLLENKGYDYFELSKNHKSMSLSDKEKLLDKLRRTKVIGMCSQDSSPRLHALDIALLSAETTNWEVFLKAHLDVMNDRFDRVSDGSYAWAGRKTYIKELEVLNINVIDLLLGTVLRFKNHNPNHYFSSIGRLGRALSETENKAEFEKKALNMIMDSELDDLNRIMIFYLIHNYMYYLTDEDHKQALKNKLETTEKSLPKYFSGI